MSSISASEIVNLGFPITEARFYTGRLRWLAGASSPVLQQEVAVERYVGGSRAEGRKMTWVDVPNEDAV